MAKKKKNKTKRKKRVGNRYHGTYNLSRKDYNILTPPSKHSYSPKNTPTVAYRLALLGMSHREIASTLGVSYSTLKRWKKDYPYFREHLDRGSVYADALVANAQFKLATGFVVEDTKIFIDKGNVITVKYDKHVLPDRAAGQWWLQNRQPKYWKSEGSLKSNTSTENTPTLNIKFTPSGLLPINSETAMLSYSKDLESNGFYDKLNSNGNGKEG